MWKGHSGAQDTHIAGHFLPSSASHPARQRRRYAPKAARHGSAAVLLVLYRNKVLTNARLVHILVASCVRAHAGPARRARSHTNNCRPSARRCCPTASRTRSLRALRMPSADPRKLFSSA